MPLAFPICDTGPNIDGNIGQYGCLFGSDPFNSNPPSAAYTTQLPC